MYHDYISRPKNVADLSDVFNNSRPKVNYNFIRQAKSTIKIRL